MQQDGEESSNSLTTATRTQQRLATDVERAVLGACLLGGRPAVEAALEQHLRDVDFSVSRNAIMWKALVTLSDRGDAVDTLTVVDELARTHKLDAVGGAAAVSQLEATLPTTAHLREYTAALMESAALRRLAETAQLIARAAVERDASAAELLAQAQEALFALNRRQQRSEVADRMRTVGEVMAAAATTTVKGLPTGWRTLDTGLLARGLRPGNLVIIGARPSMGKTVFGHQLACQVADEGIPTAFFSLEMTPAELIEREIAAKSSTETALWRAAMATGRLQRAAGFVAERHLHLVHCPGGTLAAIAAQARRLVAREGVGLIVIDYLGLVRGSSAYAGNRTQEVGEVSRGLKALAGELLVPVVALAQLNRGVEGRTDKLPGLADLRDSGEIEQDADIVGFLHRPDYYLKDKTPPDLVDVCQLSIAKQRNGPTGIARLRSELPFTRFVDFAEEDGGR